MNFNQKLTMVLEELILEDHRIYFHATEAENIPNILRKGIITNQPALCGKLGDYKYKKGHIYIGNAIDAMNYGLYMGEPCIIALKKEEEHPVELDEAVLPMLWRAYDRGLPNNLKAYEKPIRKLYRSYDLNNNNDDYERIMQDAIDGRWDNLIKDQDLIEILSYYASDRGPEYGARAYAPIRSKTKIKPESIIAIWKYKHLPEEIEGDTEEAYLNSVEWSDFAGPNEIMAAFEKSPDWERIHNTRIS
jgi:hypothetical protein